MQGYASKKKALYRTALVGVIGFETVVNPLKTPLPIHTVISYYQLRVKLQQYTAPLNMDG